MNKILISACLLGEKVRYDGKGKQVPHSCLQRWQQEGRLVPICPEVAGGLGVPRPPAEITGPNGRDVWHGEAKVITNTGKDVTHAFQQGARAALELAQTTGCTMAVLKARSPSCGSQQIYDGSFAGGLRDGMGVTAALLRQHDIAVFSEETLDQAERWEQNNQRTNPPQQGTNVGDEYL